MNTTLSVSNRSPHISLHHALALAEEARSLDCLGLHAEADRLASEARRVCHAQTALRTVGEFAGWGLRGVANGVAAVGGAVGRGVSDLGTGVAGGWTGQYAPVVGPATGVKQPNGPETAHLPSPEAEAWARSKGTSLEQMITRCRAWVAKNGSGGLVAHLTANGVPGDVIKYVNRRST